MALERLTLAPVVLPPTKTSTARLPGCPGGPGRSSLCLFRARGSQRTGSAVAGPPFSLRWSNLAGDFKKIKEWESQIKEEADSFWVMRNDLRRERKLPGFFDREVYDILDGGGPSPASLVLSLAPSAETTENEVVFDSGRTAAADDGLFSDEGIKEAAPAPISATEYESFSQGVPPPAPAPAAAQDKETSPGPQGRERERDRKRKRDAAEEEEEEEEMSLEKQLIEAMERNGRLLSSQLEIQNANSQLDREQRKDEANTLFSVLNKLADAMVRIADKL
ncbi:hypothetical protein HanIR_Chr12g0609881 [Helianthus annuus]|nr:hypothetical protein HanIR_Chr12g0609881 [Helianthus annuus]